MEAIFVGFLALVTTTALGLVTAIFSGWALMLLLGVLHSDISRAIPAAGFGTSYALALFFTWFVVLVNPGSGSSD